MRTSNSSKSSLHRKVQALALLPCVTDSARWSALRHWQGDALEGLVGIAYQPATLDKFLRELKYAQVSTAARESVAEFWLRKTSSQVRKGAAVLYVDTATKPVWTHHFSRCTKVAKLGGRNMPATSTVYLNAGCGTPVLYRSWSGNVSLPRQVGDLLKSYEALGGEDTAQRLVVIDREGHAAQLFKLLVDLRWDFIIPLRKNVIGDGSTIVQLTEWAPYGEKGDQIRGGRLRLRDSKTKDEFIDVRVVGRKRRRTGNVAWFATRTDKVAFPDTAIIDLYFARWPLQEHVFRDGNGRVHLDAQYGYGKRKTDNIAVIDKLDKLKGRRRRLDSKLGFIHAELESLQAEPQADTSAVERVEQRLSSIQSELDAAVSAGESGTSGFREKYSLQRHLEAWLQSARSRLQVSEELGEKREELSSAQERADHETEQLSRRRRVFTMDTELDQVMTAFKLTFMNLCGLLQSEYLSGSRMELDTLIRGVLTLPGERVRTHNTETIRLWRHPRDRKVMELVEAACKRLTHKKLRRGKRRLVFQLVDQPDR